MLYFWCVNTRFEPRMARARTTTTLAFRRLVATPLSANQKALSNSRCQQTSARAKFLKKVLHSHIDRNLASLSV